MVLKRLRLVMAKTLQEITSTTIFIYFPPRKIILKLYGESWLGKFLTLET